MRVVESTYLYKLDVDRSCKTLTSKGTKNIKQLSLSYLLVNCIMEETTIVSYFTISCQRPNFTI